MSAARKPLNFDLSNAEPVPAASRPANDRPKEQRQQVGARISAKTYRQLKARAALEGRKVQDLVELAIENFLAEQPEAQARNH
jgi:hypothetical protein